MLSPSELRQPILGQTCTSIKRTCQLRQDELAAAAGVGTRFIVDLEGGKETAEIGKVITVLSALGCELAIKLPSGAMVIGRSA
jgi:y4mF family transcriptional regulator